MVENPRTLKDIITAKLATTMEEEEAWRIQADMDKAAKRDAELRAHPLAPILDDVIRQVMHGKGERHGGAVTPFMEQPWLHYAKLHGRGFLTGQAAKKLEEAASTKQGDAFVQEMLGAIAYIGMAILYSQQLSEKKR